MDELDLTAAESKAIYEEIYCAMLSQDNHSDYNGQFLKEIYLVRPSILDIYRLFNK